MKSCREVCVRSKLCFKRFTSLSCTSLVTCTQYIESTYERGFTFPFPLSCTRVGSSLSLLDSALRICIPSQPAHICSHMLPSGPAPPSGLSMTHGEFALLCLSVSLSCILLSAQFSSLLLHNPNLPDTGAQPDLLSQQTDHLLGAGREGTQGARVTLTSNVLQTKKKIAVDDMSSSCNLTLCPLPLPRDLVVRQAYPMTWYTSCLCC